MIKWELITEVKDSGYYIGWSRQHPEIHMTDPMMPLSKSSVVQIGGRQGNYVVRGVTFAHSVFPSGKYSQDQSGLKLFDQSYPFADLPNAERKATELKKYIAAVFDRTTKTTKSGKLLHRPVKTTNRKKALGISAIASLR